MFLGSVKNMYVCAALWVILLLWEYSVGREKVYDVIITLLWFLYPKAHGALVAGLDTWGGVSTGSPSRILDAFHPLHSPCGL